MKRYMHLFLVLLLLSGQEGKAQLQRQDVVTAMERANDYFLKKYPDPGKPTFVKKERPSNLWTRGVYFEGLMALAEVERLTGSTKHEIYKKYIYDWGEAHKWLPRNGVTTRDAVVRLILISISMFVQLRQVRQNESERIRFAVQNCLLHLRRSVWTT